MKATHTSTVEDRIHKIRADIQSIINMHVDAVAKENPGVPPGVIRNLLTARAPACACAQYLELNREGAKPAT